MKIAVDVRVLMDEYYSGVSKYSANLLSALYQLNIENNKQDKYVLFYNSWRDMGSRLSFWKNDFSEMVKMSWPNKIFNYILQKIFNYPKLDNFTKNPDIFFSPHFNFSCFSKNKKTKKIITVHDLSFLRYPEFFSYRKNFWHQALNIKKILSEADGIVAVSNNTKHDIVELLDIPQEKIRVIHSGLDDIKPAEEIKGVASDKFFLYLGTVEPRKNLVNLIEAYNIWRQKLRSDEKILPLVLAGAKGWKTKEIFSAWKNSPFKDDIVFLGYVSDGQRESLYKRAVMFIYPSLYEGFGFPPLEAMKRNVPVISSNLSSLPEVVADAALLINPHSKEEIAEAIDLLLSDDNYRLELIEKGRERAAMFSWKETAKQYLQFFNDLKINEKN